MRCRHKWAALIALAGAAAVTLASCGQDKPAVCAQADQLQASVQKLRDVHISENGLGALTSALGEVKTEVGALGTEAGSQFQPQIDDVKGSVDRFSSSLSAAKADPGVATLSAAGTALTGVDTAVRSLRDAVAGTC